MKELNFRLGVSKIIPGEVGLFAAKNFRKGEIVASHSYFKEVYKTWGEINKMSPAIRKMVKDFCIDDEEGAYVLEDFNTISAPWYMNHSCDGNIGFDSKDNFVAVRRIKTGEELTWDYALAEMRPSFRMKCNCGSKKCRKIITGNDWKNIKDIEFMTSSLKKIRQKNA